MLRMNQIDQIKELQRQGLGPLEITGRLKLSRKTVAKYMKVEDFNGSTPGKRAPASKLDTLDEAKVLVEAWRKVYNRIRPHSSLGYRPPAPEAQWSGSSLLGWYNARGQVRIG